MEIRTTTGYIWMGSFLSYLTRVEVGYPLYGKDWVIDNLESLFGLLGKYEFAVTNELANPLRELVKQWKRELSARRKNGDEIEEWSKIRGLTEEETEELTQTALAVRKTLIAESGLKKAFILNSNHYSIDQLVENVSSLMPEDVFDRMPPLARIDMRQAGRAMAFELSTAVAFHCLRATEEVLREFYLEVVKRKRIGEPRMWGPITKHLSELSKPIPKELQAQLDNVRQNFRNPTQHPDKNYDQDEAIALFTLCIDVIQRMQKYLDLRKKMSSDG